MAEWFTTRHGKMTCLNNDTVFATDMRKGRIYEEDMVLGQIVPILNKIEGKKIILDIGAHIGSHSILYSKYVTDCDVHAFEPQSELCKLLTSNVNANSLSNVSVYNTCVGHSNVGCSMSKMLYDGYNCIVDYNTNKGLNYGGIQLGLGGEKTNMVTIDSMNMSGCTYMKVDVEGAEPLVFMGALETIRKYRPIIFFEHTDKTVNAEMKASLSIDFDVPSPVELLEREGYMIQNIDQNNKLATPVDTLYRNPASRSYEGTSYLE